jgi:hypothetical protein
MATLRYALIDSLEETYELEIREYNIKGTQADLLWAFESLEMIYCQMVVYWYSKDSNGEKVRDSRAYTVPLGSDEQITLAREILREVGNVERLLLIVTACHPHVFLRMLSLQAEVAELRAREKRRRKQALEDERSISTLYSSRMRDSEAIKIESSDSE